MSRTKTIRLRGSSRVAGWAGRAKTRVTKNSRSVRMNHCATRSLGESRVTTNESESAASAYFDYFKVLTDAQDARKSSIEQRGLAVITTSGTLATLLFGLTALISSAKSFELPVQAHGPLGVALVAFVVAALAALLTNLPLFYLDLRIGDTASELRKLWAKTHSEALILLTATRAKVLRRAQRVNSVKAWVLVTAMLAEVVGIIAVSLAVGEVLRHG